MKQEQIISAPCLARAAVIMLGFFYTINFTVACTSAHLKPLTDEILARIFLPQILASAAVFALLPTWIPRWIVFTLAGILPALVSLIEARAFLGLANLVGRFPSICWMGHQKPPVNLK